MDPIRNIRQDQRTELKSEVKQPLGQLTPQDFARLNDKHEELIMVLRQWHHYSRRQADRVFSDWLFHHSQARPYRTELFLPRGKSQPFTRPSTPDLRRLAKTDEI